MKLKKIEEQFMRYLQSEEAVTSDLIVNEFTELFLVLQADRFYVVTDIKEIQDGGAAIVLVLPHLSEHNDNFKSCVKKLIESFYLSINELEKKFEYLTQRAFGKKGCIDLWEGLLEVGDKIYDLSVNDNYKPLFMENATFEERVAIRDILLHQIRDYGVGFLPHDRLFLPHASYLD